jgi:F-type H+-transporting ATPase subunit b
VLNATLYKPINQILASREKRTRGRMSEAKEILANVDQQVADYEKSLRQARAEAYAVAENERAQAMKDRQAKINQMRDELAQSVAAEKQTIQEQAAEARAKLETESRRIALEIGSRVLSRPLSESDLN